jgi:Bacterial Ig-like domain
MPTSQAEPRRLRRSGAKSFLLALVGASLVVSASRAQTPARVAATIDALKAYPVFYHGKQVVVRSAVVQTDTWSRLAPTAASAEANPRGAGSIFVFWKDRPTRADGEIRGEFWDLGRLREDDSRFTAYDFRSLLQTVNDGRWPGRDEVFVMLGATLIESAPPTVPSVRAIALMPDRYADRGVTVVGRFRGRNLYGDLPAPLNRSQWDFVIQSADGAVWVSAIRPRGKGFELDPGAKVDTGRWLQVTGTVHHEGIKVWIDGESLQLTNAPTETTVDVVVAPVVKEAPPQVIFSAPLADETDISPARAVRVQFSRDMDPRSFRDHVRVSYAAPPAGAAPTTPVVNIAYHEGNRSLEIKFGKPLDRFQKVKVELLEGITAVDGQPLPPWTLTFTTGG